MRLIDVDLYCATICKCNRRECDKAKCPIHNAPTAYDIDKVVDELEERTDFLKGCTKYGNENAEQQAESYSTMMMYEVAELVDDLIEIVKAGVNNES